MKYIKIENFESDSQIKILSLSRPEVRNAFHPDMIAEITSFFENENFENKSQLILIRGEGKIFCAGADLNWMKDMVNYSFDENVADSLKLWKMFESIQKCQIPVIGMAHGAVFGGALGLLSACDYVYSEEKTQFCFSEVKLGLAPAVISGHISKKIPDAFYRPLMLSAEVFSALQAKNIGLIQQIYSDKIEISDVVKKFSINGFTAMKETKKLLNTLLDFQTEEYNVDRIKNECVRVISERRMSPEGQERMKNFL